MKRPLRARSFDGRIIRLLAAGGIGVVPTDTIYGIVASAGNRRAVERVYRVRRRDPRKPSIILVAGPGDLKRLGIRPTPAQKKILRAIWPGKFSVIFRARTRRYLDRGTGTLAVRWPQGKSLQRFLAVSGPLIAPSANPEGRRPALSVRSARRYFGNAVDFYIDRGAKKGRPSTLLALTGRSPRVLRRGAGRLPKLPGYGKLG